MKKMTSIILIAMIINGCSGINSQFDCPMKPGIRCESIESVNARVDRGEIGDHSLAGFSSPTIQPIEYKHSNYLSMATLSKGEPLRYGETVMRVWVAPFKDKQGNYHQESDIYIITKPGKWIGAPLKELDTNGA